jgi:hypothetical protein
MMVSPFQPCPAVDMPNAKILEFLPVGVNNHRQFLLFVGALVIAIILFIRLSIGCKSFSVVYNTGFRHRSKNPHVDVENNLHRLCYPCSCSELDCFMHFTYDFMSSLALRYFPADDFVLVIFTTELDGDLTWSSIMANWTTNDNVGSVEYG